MKKMFLLLILVIVSMSIKAQAHLGSTYLELKKFHPNVTFTIGYLDDGTKYATGDMYYGMYFYYFDNTGKTNLNIQIPHNLGSLNGQVEVYNSKYTITSTTSWKAYLEGGILDIELKYQPAEGTEEGYYYFVYTQDE